MSQAAVSKCETGDSLPSPEALHAVGFALGATVEEVLALASAGGGGIGGLPDDPEAYAQTRKQPLPYALLEVVYLGWEAELWRRAAHDARWDPCLVSIVAWRANLLVEEERYGEVAAVARRAIRLATTTEGRVEAVPAIAALADADRRLGRGHAEASELAAGWAAGLPDSPTSLGRCSNMA